MRFVIRLGAACALACWASAVAPAADMATTRPTPPSMTGPTTRPVLKLGMSTVLSGPAASLGQDMRHGVLAGLARCNRRGGVNGRLLELVALDDGYEPRRTAPNMHRLIDAERVLAVIGNVGTPTAVAAVPIADEHRTLLFAPFTGAGVLRRTPPDRYVLNYRASYAQETGAMIDALTDVAGLKATDIAFFTQRDSYGDAGFDGAVAALRRHGPVDPDALLHVRYDRNTLNVEDALATLLYAERTPRAIVMVGAYRPCAKFIRLAHGAGVDAVFLNLSFVGGEALADAAGPTPAHVIVTQVVPSPADTRLPIVREFREDLALYDPKAEPKFGSLEGYISARAFAAGLARVPGEPTRESVIDGLESLGDFDLGLGQRLHYDRNEHQACHHVWPTVLKDGQLVPFDWKDIAALVPREAE